MPLYTADSVDRVKEAVDMVGLVSPRSDLRRVGSRHVGLCPFHDERTPSFSVRADLGLYHCFGCGASGDAIRFVEATEGLDFREAIELLADRYGVELKREREDPQAEQRRQRRERLLRLVERAASYYARFLWESGEAAGAREYLDGRGFSEDTLRGFRIGYAPSAWERVVKNARRDGFTDEEIAAAGLSQQGSRGWHDRFRERIMFPLADARGRVLGFGARAMREDQRPKYLNTSENELYHKRRQLFGIDRARAPAAKAGRIVVVEGYTDVMALHQAGVPETVAIMGTALAEEQLAELSRAASSVYIALDADRSGQEAMLKAARAAQSRGLELRVVGMPDGRDPAELVGSDGAERFLALLDSALSVPEFEVRRALANADLATARGRDAALGEVRPLIAALPERTATRDELVRYVADRLDVPPGYVTSGREAGPRSAAVARPAASRPGAAAFRPAAGGSPTRSGSPAHSRSPADSGSTADSASRAHSASRSPAAAASSTERVAGAERFFLAMCVGHRELGRRYLDKLSDEHLTSPALRRARDHLAAHMEEPLADVAGEDAELAATLADIVMVADEELASEPALRLGFLQLELRRIERALRSARDEQDFQRQRELFGLREDVRTQVSTVMGEAL